MEPTLLIWPTGGHEPNHRLYDTILHCCNTIWKGEYDWDARTNWRGFGFCAGSHNQTYKVYFPCSFSVSLRIGAFE